MSQTAVIKIITIIVIKIRKLFFDRSCKLNRVKIKMYHDIVYYSAISY